MAGQDRTPPLYLLKITKNEHKIKKHQINNRPGRQQSNKIGFNIFIYTLAPFQNTFAEPSTMSTTTTTAGDPDRRPSNPALWDDIAALLDQSFGGETSTGEKKTLSKGVELRLRKLRKEGQARWRKLVTGDENKRIRDHFGGEVDRLREKSRARARELVTGDATVAIEDHLKTQPVVKLIDKLSFTLGLFGLGITEFIVLKQPQLYWLWFSAVMMLFLTLRIFSYVEKRWGFFMIDFCYFAVVMNMVWTVFYSDNYAFGQMNFMFCNGPLLVATLAWRNSLVFHSLDKMTSIFIHFLGALLTFLARWHPQGRNIICEERAISATNIMEGGEWETSVRGIDDASTRFCINSEEH